MRSKAPLFLFFFFLLGYVLFLSFLALKPHAYSPLFFFSLLFRKWQMQVVISGRRFVFLQLKTMTVNMNINNFSFFLYTISYHILACYLSHAPHPTHDFFFFFFLRSSRIFFFLVALKSSIHPVPSIHPSIH